jgi:hypothetical protein
MKLLVHVPKYNRLVSCFSEDPIGGEIDPAHFRVFKTDLKKLYEEKRFLLKKVV